MIHCLGCEKNCGELVIYAMWEARKYKWIKSQQNKHDYGHQAITEWFHDYFYQWYRNRLLEHFKGIRQWKEFGQDNYNIETQIHSKLANQILENLLSRGILNEQLGMIITSKDDELQEIIFILKKLDINNKRIEIQEECLSFLDEVFQEADKYKWIKSEEKRYDLGENIIDEWFNKYGIEFFRQKRKS